MTLAKLSSKLNSLTGPKQLSKLAEKMLKPQPAQMPMKSEEILKKLVLVMEPTPPKITTVVCLSMKEPHKKR